MRLLVMTAALLALTGCETVAPLITCCSGTFFQICCGQIVEPPSAGAPADPNEVAIAAPRAMAY